MDRRELLLQGCAVAGVVAASGCTVERLREAEREPPPFERLEKEAVDLPVPQRLAIAEEGIERAAGVELHSLEEFAEYLDEQDLRVEALDEAVEEGDPIVSLEYVAEERPDRGLMHHLGIVAGGYAALVAANGREKLEVTLLGTRSKPFGEYEVRRKWAEAYGAGDLTAREYAAKINVTVESK